MNTAFYSQPIASIHPTPEAKFHVVPASNGLADESFPENTAADAEKLLGLYHEIAKSVPDAVFMLGTINAPKEKGAEPPWIAQRFRIGDVEKMAAEARARSEHSNVYFGPALMRRDLRPGSRGTERDVVAVLAIVAEEDGDTGKFVTLPRGVLPSFEVRTSAINRHFHFVLEKPLPPAEAKALAELMFKKCGGDHGGKDISHVWRIPQTLNHPCWRKIARGRPETPQPVELIGGTGKPVNAEALRAALESMPDLHPKPTPGEKAEWRSEGSGDRNEIMMRLSPALHAKIEEEGEDRSAHCFSVMLGLFDAGLTDGEVHLVAAGAPFASKFRERGDLDDEIARARAKWQPKSDGSSGPGYSAKHFFSEDPLPLYREIERGEAFPVKALGPILGAMAKALNETAVQSPLALCGTSVLAASACAVQALCNIELPIAGGKNRVISLFFLIVGVSGERKSTTDDLALAPLEVRREELQRNYAVEFPEYKNTHDAWTAERQRILRMKGLNWRDRKVKLDDLGPEPVAPKFPALRVGSPTIEGLMVHLVDGHPSAALFTSEAGEFIGGHAMADDAKMRTASALNILWDNGGVERIRAKERIILPGRRLSSFFQAQIDVAQQFLTDPLLADIGLHSRFLVSHPESTIGHRPFKEVTPEHQLAIEAYNRHMLSLLRRELPYDERGDGLKPRALPMSADTRKEWIRFHDHVEAMCLPGGHLHEISGLANKLAEHAGRIAAVLQIFDNPDARELDLSHLERGIEIAEFYASEALRMHSASRIGVELREAERLRLWLLEKWHEPYVTIRAIQQRGPTSLREKSRIETLMGVLERHGWVAQAKGVTVEDKPTRTAWAIWGKVS